MILISHRGNLIGANKDNENKCDYIDNAIQFGFDVEIDLWFDDHGLWLGHDFAQYKVSDQWLFDRKTHLWIHAKNNKSLEWIIKNNMHGFWHETDYYTITTKQIIWGYPISDPLANMIWNQPEWTQSTSSLKKKMFEPYIGVCSDFIADIKNILTSHVD